VDELNRALQGEPCSGYITAPALVTEEALAGSEGNAFDPDNGYREAYAAIWGK
jgi:ribose transport system substrate-binding protein